MMTVRRYMILNNNQGRYNTITSKNNVLYKYERRLLLNVNFLEYALAINCVIYKIPLFLRVIGGFKCSD